MFPHLSHKIIAQSSEFFIAELIPVKTVDKKHHLQVSGWNRSSTYIDCYYYQYITITITISIICPLFVEPLLCAKIYTRH